LRLCRVSDWMRKVKQKLTLDRQVTYEITVPGVLDTQWLDWDGVTSLIVESDSTDVPVTKLISTVDQAALQGLLRRLYSLGLPLISVICVDFG
jgi:hypothetical protein